MSLPPGQQKSRRAEGRSRTLQLWKDRLLATRGSVALSFDTQTRLRSLFPQNGVLTPYDLKRRIREEFGRPHDKAPELKSTSLPEVMLSVTGADISWQPQNPVKVASYLLVESGASMDWAGSSGDDQKVPAAAGPDVQIRHLVEALLGKDAQISRFEATRLFTSLPSNRRGDFFAHISALMSSDDIQQKVRATRLLRRILASVTKADFNLFRIPFLQLLCDRSPFLAGGLVRNMFAFLRTFCDETTKVDQDLWSAFMSFLRRLPLDARLSAAREIEKVVQVSVWMSPRSRKQDVCQILMLFLDTHAAGGSSSMRSMSPSQAKAVRDLCAELLDQQFRIRPVSSFKKRYAARDKTQGTSCVRTFQAAWKKGECCESLRWCGRVQAEVRRGNGSDDADLIVNLTRCGNSMRVYEVSPQVYFEYAVGPYGQKTPTAAMWLDFEELSEPLTVLQFLGTDAAQDAYDFLQILSQSIDMRGSVETDFVDNSVVEPSVPRVGALYCHEFEVTSSDPLGEGTFSKVYRVRDQDHQEFALKIRPFAKGSYAKATEELKANIMIRKSPHLARYAVWMEEYEMCWHRHELHMVIERMDMSLEKYLDEVGHMDEADAAPIIRHIIDGLQNLRDAGVMPRDLHAGNFLLNIDSHNNLPMAVKYCDFGGAAVKDRETCTPGVCAFVTQAPEMARRSDGTSPGVYDAECAAQFAIACIVRRILYGKYPPGGRVPGALDDIDPAIRNSVSAAARSFIQAFTSTDPMNRPKERFYTEYPPLQAKARESHNPSYMAVSSSRPSPMMQVLNSLSDRTAHGMNQHDRVLKGPACFGYRGQSSQRSMSQGPSSEDNAHHGSISRGVLCHSRPFSALHGQFEQDMDHQASFGQNDGAAAGHPNGYTYGGEQYSGDKSAPTNHLSGVLQSADASLPPTRTQHASVPDSYARPLHSAASSHRTPPSASHEQYLHFGRGVGQLSLSSRAPRDRPRYVHAARVPPSMLPRSHLAPPPPPRSM